MVCRSGNKRVTAELLKVMRASQSNKCHFWPGCRDLLKNEDKASRAHKFDAKVQAFLLQLATQSKWIYQTSWILLIKCMTGFLHVRELLNSWQLNLVFFCSFCQAKQACWNTADMQSPKKQAGGISWWCGNCCTNNWKWGQTTMPIDQDWHKSFSEHW